ncbi:MAG: DUF2510 domain-containing protein, partial [Actinomycetes bacterium]
MSATVKRRPLRGCFGGALFLLGVVLLLFVYGVVALNVWYLLAFTLAGAILGLGLAYLVPVRGRPVTSPYGVVMEPYSGALPPADAWNPYPDLPPAVPASVPASVPPVPQVRAVQVSGAPPAWLVDPGDSAYLRYWDGSQWTGFR